MAGVEDRILGKHPQDKAKGLIHRKFEVVPENPVNNWIEGLPRVFPVEDGVRYSPFDGHLWLASYRTTRDPEVALKRWSPHSSIESLTGSTVEVLGKHDKTGVIANRIQELDEFIRGKLRQFRNAEISEYQLEEFQRETENMLVKAGFDKPNKTTKKKIADQVRLAMGTDRLGRRNPLISRTRLSSALLTLLTESAIRDKVVEKYSRLFVALLGEQQLEESIVVSIIESLEDGDFNPQLLREAGNISTVKSAPYRIPVMQAFGILFGVPPHRRAEFTKYFEIENVFSGILNDPNAPIAHRLPFIISNLKEAVEDGASIYSPSV